MRAQQKQNIKGISLIEVMVVLAIVGVVAGIGFPNFTKWQVDRKVRAHSEKIATVFTTATTQVERGSYPYTRVTIETDTSTSPAEVKITAHGIKQDALSNLLNAGSSIDCKNTIFSSADELISYNLDGIKLFHLAGGGGSAICFSKGGKYFKQWNLADSQQNIVLDNKTTNNYVAICYDIETNCDAPNKSFDKNNQFPVYLVNYSRLGMIQKFKWNYSKNDWRSR